MSQFPLSLSVGSHLYESNLKDALKNNFLVVIQFLKPQIPQRLFPLFFKLNILSRKLLDEMFNFILNQSSNFFVCLFAFKYILVFLIQLSTTNASAEIRNNLIS